MNIEEGDVLPFLFLCVVFFFACSTVAEIKERVAVITKYSLLLMTNSNPTEYESSIEKNGQWLSLAHGYCYGSLYTFYKCTDNRM